MTNKFITILGVLALSALVSVCAAQSPATYRDAAAWDASTQPTNWVTTGYDVLLSQTNVTAAQLGTSNAIPALAGILGSARVAPTNTVEAFRLFLATNPVPSTYTLWARTVTVPVGLTNVVVSDWTNIVVPWASLPLPPINLRVQVFGP